MRLFVVALLAAVLPGSFAQTALVSERAPELQAYTQCSDVAGAKLTETTKLVVPNSIRMVQTADGNKQVHLEDGLRLAYAFPGSAPFVSVKVEALDRGRYAQGKADLLNNFAYLLKSDELAQEDTAQPHVAGFDLHGFNHKELIGDVLGVYLILDDARAIETTIYFLNAETSQRRFSTEEEYAKLRGEFLTSYLKCAAVRS